MIDIFAPVAAQTQHAYAAHNNPQQRFSANHGTPPVAATPRPNLATHPKELPPIEHPAAPNTGNAKLDQKYQKQQEQVIAKQTQERQNLQQKQDGATSATGETKRQSGKNAASGTATPATDAAIAAKTHAADAADATETAAAWRRISRRRASLIKGLPVLRLVIEQLNKGLRTEPSSGSG